MLIVILATKQRSESILYFLLAWRSIALRVCSLERLTTGTRSRNNHNAIHIWHVALNVKRKKRKKMVGQKMAG